MQRPSRPSAPPDPDPARRPGTTVVLAPSPGALTLLGALRGVLAERGVAGFLVGGAVRDALLGRPTGDVDVAVAGDVRAVVTDLVASLGATAITLDEPRQVVRLVPHGDAGAYLDVSPLRGTPPSPDGDVRSRDFTIDALLVPLETLDLVGGRGALLDPTGGLDDLARRQVRAITDDVFIDDPARLLRAVRLAAELGFAIETRTAALVRRDARLLAGVAGERVRAELCRILAAPGARQHLWLLDGLGLLTVVLPELEEARGVEQPKEHYWDVFQHSLEAVQAMEQVLRIVPGGGQVLDETPWDAEMAAHFNEAIGGDATRAVLTKLAALLHDVAKPATRTIEPSGRIRFFGHPKLGAAMTERAMERLRFSNREVRMVATMVREHLRPALISRGEEGPTQRALYRFFRDAGEVAADTLFLSFADYLAARGPLLELDDWRQHSAKLRAMLERWRHQAQAPSPRLVDGHDLMREFRLQPGPRLGVLLEAVREGQAAGELCTREDALALVRRMLEGPAQVPSARGKG